MGNSLNGKITKVGCCSEVIRFQRLPDNCVKVLILSLDSENLDCSIPFQKTPIEWDS